MGKGLIAKSSDQEPPGSRASAGVQRRCAPPPFLSNQRPSLIKDPGSRNLAFIPSQVTEKEAASLGMLEEPQVGGEGGMQRGSRGS